MPSAHLKSFIQRCKEKWSRGELWEIWVLALIILTLVAIVTQPLTSSHVSLSDFRPGVDPYDTKNAHTESAASRF